jgi:hypothetical protein
MAFWSAEVEHCLEQDSDLMLRQLNELCKRMDKGLPLPERHQDYYLDTDSNRYLQTMLFRSFKCWHAKNKTIENGSI